MSWLESSPRYRPFLERFPVLRLIGGTRLFPIPGTTDGGAQILAKAEWSNPGGSVKDRPVAQMLLEASIAGELTPGRRILDSSSGNAGIAYAMIGAMMGVPVTLVVPGNASAERKERILAHGAQLRQTDPLEGYDAALREAHRLATSDPALYFMPDQYANRHNWMAHYDGTASEILEQTAGRLTHLVAGIGTGGTLTGVGRRLKEHDARLRVVCVVPEAFPGIEGLKPLESPQDIVPEILDASLIDERIRVSTDEAASACLDLARAGLFVGQSSGAYFHAARQVARREPGARIVTIFSDLGERYFSTRLWRP
ncbi:MAG TPA: cysteine synthase family protein [Candidatus Polarisedimenticolia bacterium]|nr:cysteine synthase family protein [Candidatus Polarisedimenticolia bacterium]